MKRREQSSEQRKSWHTDQLGGLRSRKVSVDRTSGVKDGEADDKAEQDGSHREEFCCYFGRSFLL